MSFLIPLHLRLQLTLIFVVGVALLKTGAWFWLGIYGAIAFFLSMLLRSPLKPLLKLLGAELIFLTFMALPLGFERASFVLTRSLICLFALNSCLLSLPPNSQAIALQSLPLPKAFKEIALLASHYLIILISEVAQMQQAAKCRGLKGTAGWLRYASAALIGALYLRSLDRSERVYKAMIVRGYQGQLPVATKTTLKQRFALWFAMFVAMSLTVASYHV